MLIKKVLTGTLNSICAYAAALSFQSAIHGFHRRRHDDPEKQLHSPVMPRLGTENENCHSMQHQLAAFGDRSRKCHSETSTLVNNIQVANADNEVSTTLATSATRPLCGLQKNFGLAVCFLFVTTTGLPISVMTGSDTVLDTQLLVFLWLAFLAAQAGVKRALWLQPRPKMRTLLFTMLNAVLWTSLVMIGYAWAKTAIRQTTIKETILNFVTGIDLANLIRGAYGLTGERKSPVMGAGDIALSILNAGIVSWGLKLFECRSQLLSRAGMTILAVCTVTAAGNVIIWPLLAHATGLRPASRDLAFAARSVTIALGGPALDALGGDGGLNAVMVVFNGIIFQMLAGLGAGEQIKRLKRTWESLVHARTGDDNVEKPRAPEVLPAELEVQKLDDAGTVAAGVAVGINAAAMGTSHLYEQGSRAAPYSTISMTLFGAMTVVLTSIGPLTKWLVAQVAQ